MDLYWIFCRDGIPPYKLGTKKLLQREIHRSVKINGQVTLPHFPVSSTSCVFLFFFCLESAKLSHTDRQLGPDSLKELCFLSFHSSCCDRILYFIPSARFTYESQGKWKAGFAYYFTSSSSCVGVSCTLPSSSPIAVASVNINFLLSACHKPS